MKPYLIAAALLLGACSGATKPPLCDTPDAAKCGRGEDRTPVAMTRPEPAPEPEPDEPFVFENDGSGLFYDNGTTVFENDGTGLFY
jgi:hypothetical protein